MDHNAAQVPRQVFLRSWGSEVHLGSQTGIRLILVPRADHPLRCIYPFSRWHYIISTELAAQKESYGGPQCGPGSQTGLVFLRSSGGLGPQIWCCSGITNLVPRQVFGSSWCQEQTIHWDVFILLAGDTTSFQQKLPKSSRAVDHNAVKVPVQIFTSASNHPLGCISPFSGWHYIISTELL